MLAPAPQTQRFLEAIQIVLAFVSVCAVVDASANPSPLERAAGYCATAPHESERAMDRRLADLARVERKRREAEQLTIRRNFEPATAASLDGAAAAQPLGERPAQQGPRGARSPACQHVGGPMDAEIHAARADEHRQKHGEPDQIRAHR